MKIRYILDSDNPKKELEKLEDKMKTLLEHYSLGDFGVAEARFLMNNHVIIYPAKGYNIEGVSTVGETFIGNPKGNLYSSNSKQVNIEINKIIYQILYNRDKK